jgi:hypothetical protein
MSCCRDVYQGADGRYFDYDFAITFSSTANCRLQLGLYARTRASHLSSDHSAGATAASRPHRPTSPVEALLRHLPLMLRDGWEPSPSFALAISCETSPSNMGCPDASNLAKLQSSQLKQHEGSGARKQLISKRFRNKAAAPENVFTFLLKFFCPLALTFRQTSSRPIAGIC